MHQGEVPKKCYFVLKGCVRQFAVDEAGRETTFNVFTEEQGVTIFNQHTPDKASKYSLSCLEDCVLVVGDLSIEQQMYQKGRGNRYDVLKLKHKVIKLEQLNYVTVHLPSLSCNYLGGIVLSQSISHRP